jgi:predicted nuclease with RNAse H fold
MIIVGIDPSGPSNHKDTCIVWFRDEVVELIFQDYISGASDKSIVDLISDLADEEQVCIGLDAPLSYNDGGGMRPCDKHLQATIIPRSISHLETKHIVKVVETHPGATFALGGAPIGAVRDYSRNRESRSALFDWLVENELHGIPEDLVESSHLIASCGCALAAWKWLHNESQWCWPSNPFHHLFDFAC